MDGRAQPSADAWRTLGLQLRSVTPSHVARIVLVASALGSAGWLLVNAWELLLPFQLGFVLAYVTLPIVDVLDHFMPRWLAATLVVVVELFLIAALIGLLVPPLATEALQLVQALPSPTEVEGLIAELRAAISTLPEPTQNLIRNAANQLATTIRSNLLDYVPTRLCVLVASVFDS